MLVTPLGMVIDGRLVQEQKAPSWIAVRLSGRVTEVRPEQLRNA